MPRLVVEGVGKFEIEEGKRLVLAIEENAGVDILHRCGAQARCTTCRIEYLKGEPEMMTRAELGILQEKELLGKVRLACQAVVDRDMEVRPLKTVGSTGAVNAGRKPEPKITPHPEWVERPV